MWEWDRRYVSAAAGAALLILGVAAGMAYSERRHRQQLIHEIVLPAAPAAAETAPAEEPGEFVVYVGGAVQNPGVYTLPAGARVHEAIGLALPAADADLDVVGMARELEDGETLYVPSRSETAAAGAVSGAPAAGWASGAAPSGKVNINQASAQELEAGLPGVGEVLARNIVEYRETNGKFARIEDLKNVSGIGAKKYEALESLITVR
jgi:competence protein ComEA